MGSKGDKTKEKILEEACALFHFKGYRGTSVDDILKASKVTKGNFYFHFKNKEALGFSVIDAFASRSALRFRKIFEADQKPLDKVYALFLGQEKSLRVSGCRGGCFFGNLSMELADHYPAFRAKLEAVFDGWEKSVRDCLVEAQRTGALKNSIDPRTLSRLIVAAFEGSALLAKTRKKSAVYRDCVKSLGALLES